MNNLPNPPGRVVVGIDTTLAGLQALRRAVAEARWRGLPLRAVRAWVPGPPHTYPGPADQRREESAAAAEVVGQAFADTFGGFPDDLDVKTVLLADRPGPALLSYATRETDLLVLGAGRRRRWRRPLRRPVTRHCLARATCPVLVVPPPLLTQAATARMLLRELRREIDNFTGD